MGKTLCGGESTWWRRGLGGLVVTVIGSISVMSAGTVESEFRCESDGRSEFRGPVVTDVTRADRAWDEMEFRTARSFLWDCWTSGKPCVLHSVAITREGNRNERCVRVFTNTENLWRVAVEEKTEARIPLPQSKDDAPAFEVWRKVERFEFELLDRVWADRNGRPTDSPVPVDERDPSRPYRLTFGQIGGSEKMAY